MGSKGTFSIKSRICIFCASGIASDENNDPLNQTTELQDSIGVSIEVFLKGVAVLCEILKVESKLTSEDNWDLKGEFVSLVCCEKCGILMNKLVSLHQLMVETRTCLEQNVRKLEHSIVESTKWAEDVEYSIKACIEFREEIISNYQKGLEFVSVIDCEEALNLEGGFRELNEDSEGCPSSQRNENRVKGKVDNIRECFVDLQRIDPALIKIKCEDLSGSLDCVLEDGNSTRATRIATPRRRGRQRKCNAGDVPTKKPRKEAHSEEFPLQTDIDNFPTAILPDTEFSDENEFVGNIEHSESTGDEDYQPSRSNVICSSSSSSSSEELHHVSSASDEDPEYTPVPELEKTRKKRKSEVGSRTRAYPKHRSSSERKCRYYQGFNFRPIFVVNEMSGIFMFMNVKIQRESTSLHCKHPWCDFSTGELGYFQERDAFDQMRQHIVSTHRRPQFKRSGFEDSPQYYCWMCEEWMNFKNTLVEHLKGEHGDPKCPLTICDICGSTMIQKYIAKHRSSHQNPEEKSIEISIGPRTRPDLRKHFKPTNSKSRSPSEELNANTSRSCKSKKTSFKLNKPITSAELQPFYVVNRSSNTYMFLYVKIEKESSELFCKFPKCDFSTGRMEYFSDQDVIDKVKQHVKEAHREVMTHTSSPLYYCWHCDEYIECKNPYRYTLHLKREHEDTKFPQAMCEICGMIKKYNIIVYHRLTHKNVEEMPSGMLQGRRKKQVQEHKNYTSHNSRIRLKKSVFPCDKCDKAFPNSGKLHRHRKLHEPSQQHICDICGKSLFSQSNLKTHREVMHFKERPKKNKVCPICDRKFTAGQKTYFDSHVLSHSGERNFQCFQCGKRFFSKGHLHKHERMHREPMLPCEFCATLVRNNRMKEHHRRRHADLIKNPPPRTRPDVYGPKLAFPCEPCGKVYTYKSQLVVHMKQVHKLLLARNEDYPMQNILENDNKP